MNILSLVLSLKTSVVDGNPPVSTFVREYQLRTWIKNQEKYSIYTAIMFTKLYWLLPLISALVWCGMLLGLLLNWVCCFCYIFYAWGGRPEKDEEKQMRAGCRGGLLRYTAGSIKVASNEAATILRNAAEHRVLT